MGAVRDAHIRIVQHAMIVAPEGGFVGPVKRSVTIAGHATSISLEPCFWSALEAAAVARQLPLSALVAQIDALRVLEEDRPNLASAIRSWLFHEVRSARISIDSESHSQ